MLIQNDIETLIQSCREIAKNGLGNGCQGNIHPLQLDILSPPYDFLGVNGNPAVFVNKSTFKLLGKNHANWVSEATIAVKQTFLRETPLQIAGIIAHETGHAFNVAINIENTETNAYIFEIEALRCLIKNQYPLLNKTTEQDIQNYFKSRLEYYKQTSNPYLQQLIEEIKKEKFIMDPNPKKQPVRNITSFNLFYRDAKTETLSLPNGNLRNVDLKREEPRL